MKKRVLLVDDDPDILAALTMLLEERYAIETASNGSEAVDRLATTRYDAVLLDLMMPIMDGAAFKEELTRRHIAVPILLTSAGADLAERAAAIGVADYITKPLDFDKLEDMLATMLAKAEPGQSAASASVSTSS
jgi:two-component system response regulator MprA